MASPVLPIVHKKHRLLLLTNPHKPELQKQYLRKSTPSAFLFPLNEVLFCGKNSIKVKKDGTIKEEQPDESVVLCVLSLGKYICDGWRHVTHWIWLSVVKVKVVDLPPIEADFHVSRKKEFYASYSNFQHNKKIASESNETVFYCNSRSRLYFCRKNLEKNANWK